MKMFRLSIMLCAITLFGCASNHEKADSEAFPKEYALKHKKHCDILSKQPQLQVADSVLIITTHSHTEKVCQFYSIDGEVKEIGSFGGIGNGPNEFLQPVLTYAERNTFGINDINLSSLAILQVTKEKDTIFVEELKRLKAPYKPSKEDFVPKDIRFVKLGEKNFVSNLNAGNGRFFTLFNSSLQPIIRFGDAPIKDDLSPYVMRSRLNGLTAAYHHTFFYATGDLPYLASYSLRNGAMEKDWEIFYKQPFYGISNGDIKYIKDKTTGPMIDMKVDDRYVYILYLDQLLSEYDYTKTEKSCANKVFVFNHKGERVACLNLDCRLSNIAIDSRRKKMYGIAEIPDVSLVEFSLPEELF